MHISIKSSILLYSKIYLVRQKQDRNLWNYNVCRLYIVTICLVCDLLYIENISSPIKTDISTTQSITTGKLTMLEQQLKP
jgi:hypothetical protein